MKITIEIPEEEIKEAVIEILSRKIVEGYGRERSLFSRSCKEVVRETLYKEKDVIIDKIIAQAVPHMVTKGVDKALKMIKDANKEETL